VCLSQARMSSSFKLLPHVTVAPFHCARALCAFAPTPFSAGADHARSSLHLHTQPDPHILNHTRCTCKQHAMSCLQFYPSFQLQITNTCVQGAHDMNHKSPKSVTSVAFIPGTTVLASAGVRVCMCLCAYVCACVFVYGMLSTSVCPLEMH